MWEIIFTACGIISGNCLYVIDTTGPHKTEQQCVANLYEINAIVARSIDDFRGDEIFHVQGVCVKTGGEMS